MSYIPNYEYQATVPNTKNRKIIHNKLENICRYLWMILRVSVLFLINFVDIKKVPKCKLWEKSPQTENCFNSP